MRLFNIFTESKDHDTNTNEPSSQAHSMRQGKNKRRRECETKTREDSPMSIKNIINKLEKEQNPKRNVGTAATYNVKAGVPNLEQPIHAQRNTL